MSSDYDEGYDAGYRDGYAESQGENDRYDEGWDDGQGNGYDEGYSDGVLQAEHEGLNTAITLFNNLEHRWTFSQDPLPPAFLYELRNVIAEAERL